MNKYYIFSLRLANALTENGFEIIGRGINTRNPKYSVFYFEDTKELRNTLQKLQRALPPTINK